VSARPATLLGLAQDAGCENFTDADNGHHNRSAPPGYCITKGGRHVLARYGADRACWPCTIAALLSETGEVPR